jgi:hypothetical protein
MTRLWRDLSFLPTDFIAAAFQLPIFTRIVVASLPETKSQNPSRESLLAETVDVLRISLVDES